MIRPRNDSGLDRFDPLVAGWFCDRLGDPTPAQREGWSRIAAGEHTLIAAPTGSGKTLAAFLWSLSGLVGAARAGTLGEETAVVYVSPLKALGNDVQKNLLEPLAEIHERASAGGEALPVIRVSVRTGDTSARERAAMVKRPPHILITTPESLYILLTSDGGRRILRTARTVIVDEIHAVAGDKRGAHLALSLERLDAAAGRPLQRIGLSATQKPVERVARLLVGTTAAGESPCAIVDIGHRRPWSLSIETLDNPLGAIASHEHWAEVYDRLAARIQEHRTTLVFVHTRALAERVTHQLAQRLGEDRVATHHGSLSRTTRLDAERRLKAGTLSAVVATASLELGIDIGHVDLVCHVGAPRAIANLLQRVGRAGHGVGGVSKGILFPVTRDDLVQAAAAVRAVRAGALDLVLMPVAPLDVLAQQIVAEAAAGPIAEDALWAMTRRAYPYRDLPRARFDELLTVLSDGIATNRGRRGALLHRDRVEGTVRGRRGARIAAVTSGGAIPEIADFDVVEEPAGTFIGRLNEDFAIESNAGDVFLLGNTSWRIRRVEQGRVRVENAHGASPTIPFWIGESPARTVELSQAVSELREAVAARMNEPAGAIAWLVAETGLDAAGAGQVVAYVRETAAVLGVVPTIETVVAERFFDEAGGMQLVLHAPFGGRINRAWGLALRKCFCRTFDFELQAAATDDGILLSLGEQHSFPLEAAFSFVREATLREDLTQAILQSPIFETRWRHNAGRALAVLRHTGGRRVPANIQRMRAADLLAAVFPEQVGCQDNHHGEITPPDHPYVNETLHNCLHEAMDLDGLRAILRDLREGRIRAVAVDTPTPSAMSHEIINAQPYAFLDDAPLEERRARAVSLRRTDPDLARGIGALDAAAIEAVRASVQPDLRDADEVHDHLLTIGILPEAEAEPWHAHLDDLRRRGRAVYATWSTPAGEARRGTVAVERVAWVRAAMDGVIFAGDPAPPGGIAPPASAEDALRSIVGGWMQTAGPVTAAALAARLGWATSRVDVALAALEATGVVLRGSFTGDGRGEEWCDRRLLARIHRMTLGRLRAEIEPVFAADFMRFLFRWQHVLPGQQRHGRDGLAEAIGQLQGLELPAPAWEEHVLPARVAAYDPSDLETLCLSGSVTWGRMRAGDEDAGTAEGETRRRGSLGRNAPIAFLLRENAHALLRGAADRDAATRGLSSAARAVLEILERRGAVFLADITRATRLLPAQVEEALWTLVSRGLATGDGVAGLRHLLSPAHKRNGRPRRLHLVAARPARALAVGRWALWRESEDAPTARERDEAWATQLVRRYGVVFRDVLAREKHAPPWRVLAEIYRRAEARGELRGGRFVGGFVGEQFALPAAIEGLRAVRRAGEEDRPVLVHAADPLNLVGILVPGTRISPYAGVTIAFANGVPTEIGPLGTVLGKLRASGAVV